MSEGKASSKKENKIDTISRVGGVYAALALFFLAIFVAACKIAIVDGEKWRAKRQQGARSVLVEANRGNIYDCNNKLLASTIPTYRVFIDFKADGFDSRLFHEKIDSLSLCFSRLLGELTPQEFKAYLLRGQRKGARYYRVGRDVSYTEYNKIKTFPFFNIGKKSGFSATEVPKRKKPFGTLAARTIGYLSGEKGKGGSCGIEMAFNAELAGRPGSASRQKKAGRVIQITESKPVEGMDVYTTIDADIQDITEDALMHTMMATRADHGCAVVMDVRTGDVKAITNLKQVDSLGRYVEIENYAINSMTEPGSTFKTVSVMVALDDGKVDTSKVYDTGCGQWKGPDWTINDHNIRYKNGKVDPEGGYHAIRLSQALWYSSNIGIAKMVDSCYGKDPRKFVDHIYRMKLKEPMDLVLPGAGTPRIKHPKADNNWSGVSLKWMSYGYEMQIPPIYTLAFYNGIANNGCMLTPQFVKAVRKGEKLEKFECRKPVMNPQLCSGATLKKVRCMLEGVMKYGTGKGFASDKVSIAGKTGTAQIEYWKDKGKGKPRKHQISFCGYFPADNPQYSCIAVIWAPVYAYGNPAGRTFKEIAERIYARCPGVKNYPVADASGPVSIPASLRGMRKPLARVLRGIDVSYEDFGNDGGRTSDWVRPTSNSKRGVVELRPDRFYDGLVPNVVGMGLKDALFILEKSGYVCTGAEGYGAVREQSPGPGAALAKGQRVHITLMHDQ